MIERQIVAGDYLGNFLCPCYVTSVVEKLEVVRRPQAVSERMRTPGVYVSITPPGRYDLCSQPARQRQRNRCQTSAVMIQVPVEVGEQVLCEIRRELPRERIAQAVLQTAAERRQRDAG